MSFDHKVPWRSDERVEESANNVLKAVNSPAFNVMALLRKHYIRQPLEGSGHLALKLISPQAKQKTPFVRFKPFELHLTQDLINAGDRNLPEARHILAHELGHIAMHRAYQNFFSNGSGVKLNFLAKEESSECQAQSFAGYLLLPDRVFLEQMVNIQNYCNVPAELVIDRQQQFSERLASGFYVPQNCICGSSIARRHGLLLVCCGCGMREHL